MRGIVCCSVVLFFGLVPSFGSVASIGVASAPVVVTVSTTPQSCPAGKPVTAFNLVVQPPKGGEALPVNTVNLIEPGDKLEYAPAKAPAKGAKPKGPARVAILLASVSGNDAGKIEVLEVKPASVDAEWTVPMRASVVGLVYGPDGLSEQKISKFVKNDPELVLKLTDYVEQTSKMEALVQTLAKYQQSAPGTSNLQASLTEFSSEYGVAMPAVSGETSGVQSEQLLQAVNPAFTNDPLEQTSMTSQSTSVAASVATYFMGPQFGIIAGGTALLGELRILMFPRAEFRAAFTQPLPASGMDLCTGKPPAGSKVRTRVAYLWAVPVPNAEAPVLRLPAAAVHIPLGWKSTVDVTPATVSELKLLPRVREWDLASAKTDVAVPVKVTIGQKADALAVDLTHAKLTQGEYHLVAKWDWSSVTVAGNVDLMNFGDYSAATLSTASRDQLVAGAGPVTLQLSGTDFEFANGVTLVRTASKKSASTRLDFSLPDGVAAGLQDSMTADVDTLHLAAGPYVLRLSQLNGKTRDIPVTLHTANPVLDDLPVRVNLGQKEQTIDLRGTSLDHIDKITSDSVVWALAPPVANTTGTVEREATIHLDPQAKNGEVISGKIFVEGLEEPLEIPGLLRVAGPRPQILSATKSFAENGGVELREKEIPANSEVSFAIQGEHFDSHSRLHLECESPDDTLQDLNLVPGERNGPNDLEAAGDGTLFLSISAGSVGQSGCVLMATLTDADTGTSDAFSLGRVIRLPRIDNFSLTDEKLGESLYAGILTGQDLQTITKTGWDGKKSLPVQGIPTPVPGQPQEQTLKIAMPWPPPGPRALLYVWLSGETEARTTSIKYQ